MTYFKELEFNDLPNYCFFRFIKEQSKSFITDTCYCKSTIFYKYIYHDRFYFQCYNCGEIHLAEDIILKVQLIPHISI